MSILWCTLQLGLSQQHQSVWKTEDIYVWYNLGSRTSRAVDGTDIRVDCQGLGCAACPCLAFRIDAKSTLQAPTQEVQDFKTASTTHRDVVVASHSLATQESSCIFLHVRPKHLICSHVETRRAQTLFK